jgi:hypothetical protein
MKIAASVSASKLKGESSSKNCKAPFYEQIFKLNFAAVGDSVTIKPEALEAPTGTVRWKEDGWLGVEFNNPMYGPVVDYLAKTNVSKP